MTHLRISLVMLVCLANYLSASTKEELALELLNLESVSTSFERLSENTNVASSLLRERLGEKGFSTEKTEPHEKLQEEILYGMTKNLSWGALKDDFIGIYTETYSYEELKGLVEFFQSPLGKSFVEKQALVNTKVNDLLMSRMLKSIPDPKSYTKQKTEESIPEINYTSKAELLLFPEREVGNDASSQVLDNYFKTQLAILESKVMNTDAKMRYLALNPTSHSAYEKFSVTAARKDDTNIIVVTSTSTDPKYAQSVLDCLMKEYCAMKNPEFSDTPPAEILQSATLGTHYKQAN